MSWCEYLSLLLTKHTHEKQILAQPGAKNNNYNYINIVIYPCLTASRNTHTVGDWVLAAGAIAWVNGAQIHRAGLWGVLHIPVKLVLD